MSVIVTWKKAGLVAAFVEEHRALVTSESRLEAAFAGAMGSPSWALWPWWPRLARDAGCVRIMDYAGMAALDRAPGRRGASEANITRRSPSCAVEVMSEREIAP